MATNNKNWADVAGSANAKNADAVGNINPTDLIQQQHLDAAISADGHAHAGQYLPASAALDDFSDVTVAGAADGQVIVYRAGLGWVLENGADVFPSGGSVVDLGARFERNTPSNTTAVATQVRFSSDGQTLTIAGPMRSSENGVNHGGRYVAIYEIVNGSFSHVAGIRPPENANSPTTNTSNHAKFATFAGSGNDHVLSVSPDGSQILVTGYDRRGDDGLQGSGAGVWVYNRPGASWAPRGFDYDNTKFGEYDAFHLLQDSLGQDIKGITSVTYAPTVMPNGNFRFFAKADAPTNVDSKVTGVHEIIPNSTLRPTMAIELRRGVGTSNPTDQPSKAHFWTKDNARFVYMGSSSDNSPSWWEFDHTLNTAVLNTAPATESSRNTKSFTFGEHSEDGNTFITGDFFPSRPSSDPASYTAYIWRWNGTTYQVLDTLIWGQDHPMGRDNYYATAVSDGDSSFQGWSGFWVSPDGNEVWAGGYGRRRPDTFSTTGLPYAEVMKYVWNGSEYIEQADPVFTRSIDEDNQFVYGKAPYSGDLFVTVGYCFYWQ